MQGAGDQDGGRYRGAAIPQDQGRGGARMAAGMLQIRLSDPANGRAQTP
jgi:hypothetical protein